PTQGYLWAYGCGPGWYQGAVGIGDSEDFGTQDPKVVFTMLLGSYFGDWDSPNNFLRAPLASPTYGLVSVWAGLPNWYAHPMALGETIGYITRQTQNDNTVYNDYTNVGYVHIALMGDPTLRMHPVIPPTNLTASAGSGAVTLNWASSPDTVLGYHVYRSTTPEGPYTRITATPVTGTSYTNLGLSPGEYTYMVRAVKRETSGSGTYINLSQGVFLTVTVTAPATFDVGLVPGWNLVSFPIHPDQTAPADVLGAIEGYYDVVYTYNGCDTADPWAQYVPGAPAYANDLTAMDETQGFWIDVSTATTLQVGGAVPEASSIPLCAGWNMVGYPALTAQPPADALASLASGGCVRVYAYNPTNATDPWKMYNSCAPAYTNDLAQMEPGWGYWMYVEQAGTWSVP
ncbi:MAG: fibronectin type III domain-containing protein, partial [Anaerolineae bacterium]|nr:fibronectin type III domain-containing protein [Anaerolineae bacterium]